MPDRMSESWYASALQRYVIAWDERERAQRAILDAEQRMAEEREGARVALTGMRPVKRVELLNDAGFYDAFLNDYKEICVRRLTG